MSFEKTMLAIAMESGEVLPEPSEDQTIDDVVASGDLTDDLVYAYEQRSAELVKAIGFIDSFESLNHAALAQDLTQESFEGYEKSVAALIAQHGIEFPVSVMVPSFEAAEADKKSIKDKAAGVINSIWEWIKAQWKKLQGLVGRLNVFSQAKLARVKKASKDLKDRLTGEKAKSEESTESAQGGRKAPKWMVSNGKLDTGEVHQQMAIAFGSAEFRRVSQVGEKAGGPIINTDSIKDPLKLAGALQEFLAENGQEKYYESKLKPLVSGEETEVTDYEPQKIIMISGFIVSRMEDEVKVGEDLRARASDQFMSHMEKLLKGDNADKQQLMAIRSCVQRICTAYTRSVRLNEQGIEVLNKLHSKLESLSKLRAA